MQNVLIFCAFAFDGWFFDLQLTHVRGLDGWVNKTVCTDAVANGVTYYCVECSPASCNVGQRVQHSYSRGPGPLSHENAAMRAVKLCMDLA